MPDIAMCKNESCPSKEKCHRFTATPSKPRQSYDRFAPIDKEDKCDFFWDNKYRK